MPINSWLSLILFQILQYFPKKVTVLLVIKQLSVSLPTQLISQLRGTVIFTNIFASLFQLNLVFVLHDVQELFERYFSCLICGLFKIVLELLHQALFIFIYALVLVQLVPFQTSLLFYY